MKIWHTNIIMKQKKKLILIIVAILIIAIIAVYFISSNKEENTNILNEENTQDGIGLIDMNNTQNVNIVNGEKQNNSENLLKDREFDGLLIKEIQLYTQNGMTEFTAKVINDTGKDFSGKIVNLKFTNKDGSDYAQLEVYMPEIKAGGTNFINAATTADIANAYDFSIE